MGRFLSAMTILMTYGADLGEIRAGVAALATLYLTLRRPREKHRRRPGSSRSESTGEGADPGGGFT